MSLLFPNNSIVQIDNALTVTNVGNGPICTFEMWFRLNNNSSTTLVSFTNVDNNGRASKIYIAKDDPAADAQLRIADIIDGLEANIYAVQNGTNSWDFIPVVNSWYHLAIVINLDATINLYVDGGASAYIGNIASPGFTFNPTGPAVQNIQIQIGDAGLTQNFNAYNIEYIPSIKYDTAFTPSVDLPLVTNTYKFIIYVKSYIIAGSERITKVEPILGTINVNNVQFISTVPSIDMPAEAVAKSTICFVAGTPVLTDNFGYVPINELDADVHTIGGKKILVVTRTVTPERHLILIKEGTIAPGVPSVDTVTTHNHKIKINTGEMVKSYEIPGAQLIDYHGQSLYNVALKDGGNEMIVNNMTVETLDPENLITKVHVMLKDATLDQRKEILHALENFTQQLLEEGVIH